MLEDVDDVENDLDEAGLDDAVLEANSRMILVQDDHNRILDVAAEGIIADNEIVKLLEVSDQVHDKVNVVGVGPNVRVGLVRGEGDAPHVEEAEARKKVDWGQ